MFLGVLCEKFTNILHDICASSAVMMGVLPSDALTRVHYGVTIHNRVQACDVIMDKS